MFNPEQNFANRIESKKDVFLVVIPESEMEFTFSRSGGKGGQNVNKVSTKVTLKWNVLKSRALNQEQKQTIARELKNRMDGEGNLIVYAQSERSQYQNRREAADKLHNLINQALIPEKERIATKPTKSSKEKRLEEKKEKSGKKESRKKIIIE